MQIIETKGNQNLMNRDKTLFLCSKMTPIGLYDYVFNWTDSLTEKDCIACFDSTELESEVLKALLVANIPTILFVMNRFSDVNNIQIERALKENRILIVVLRRNEPKGEGTTPRLRNDYVLSLCQHVVCGYINKNGSVFPLLAGRKDVVKLIDENLYSMAAEPIERHERWTVAQDKMLLRMFYDDMGIHAIHKQLQRTYAAVYARLHSITLPENLLKGREFEDYVLSLFNIQESDELFLQEWQGDKSYGIIKPENNSNPDFVFRYKQSEFAVECKWREKLSRDWSNDVFSTKKIEDYKHFSEVRNMPVTIILGVGGAPCNPELLYKIPLKKVFYITSGKQSIVDYLYPLLSFDVSLFLKQEEKPKEKTYTLDEKRKHFPNAYKLWSAQDDKLLITLYYENRSMEELMSIFERNEGAIHYRIKKLIGKSYGWGK
ncbi:MAG: hypothetical protein IKO20_03870 [Bacteroidaceae bacterium]|nr:hypothetical protein [Bacteroidaceae bacterium]